MPHIPGSVQKRPSPHRGIWWKSPL